MQEKYNGIWIDIERDNSAKIVFEEYLSESEKLHVIYERNDGDFQPNSYVKKDDRQWRLPIWSAENTKTIMPSLELAKDYLSSYA